MSTKKLQIVTPIVTSVNGETGDVKLNSLKNPNALTFTGGATGSYDGSSAKTVAIPSVDSALSSTSTNPVQNKIVNSAINAIKTDIGDINTIGDIDATVCDAIAALNDGKVDKIAGKSLSTNDYTTTEKNKLAGIAEGANKTTVPAKVSAFTNDAGYATTTYVDDSLSGKQDAGDYATNTALTNGLSGKANSSHNHAASNITSGTLPIARGGTNASTAATARTNLGFSYGTSVPTSAPATGNGAVFFCQDSGNPLAIADGGTGATTVDGILSNLGTKRTVCEAVYNGIVTTGSTVSASFTKNKYTHLLICIGQSLSGYGNGYCTYTLPLLDDNWGLFIPVDVDNWYFMRAATSATDGTVSVTGNSSGIRCPCYIYGIA